MNSNGKTPADMTPREVYTTYHSLQSTIRNARQPAKREAAQSELDEYQRDKHFREKLDGARKCGASVHIL